MRKALPAVLIVFALASAAYVGKNTRSRESVLPLSRAVADHEKAIDRGSAVVFRLPPDEERRIGEGLDASMAPREVPAPGTPEAGRAALWRELGQEAASAPLVSRFRGRYEFRTVGGFGANAFALPGGFVYGTDALIARLGSDADAILFVIGHELGHIELGHCADAYRLRAGAKDPVRAVLGGVSSVARVFAALHFSGGQELEADAYAVRLMRSMRRDPAAALRAMDALGLTAETNTKRRAGTVAVEGLADYFSTHPGAWERRAALEREIGRGS